MTYISIWVYIVGVIVSRTASPYSPCRSERAVVKIIDTVFCCLSGGCEGIRFYFEMRCLVISNVNYQINEEITDAEVRLIDEDGTQLGIMASEDAMKIAIEKEVDLVKIAGNSTPPVCKIMDYGKYRYEQAKREKEVRRHQHIVEVKEIRMSPSIGTNDFNVKLRNGQKFLKEGDRLKVTIRFRGREMAHTDIGEKLLLKFAEDCAEFGNVDKNPKLDGRHMSLFLTPKQTKH